MENFFEKSYDERMYCKKNSGFTLVEILIAVMILSLLSISAYSMFVQSTGNFKFIAQFKNAVSAIKTARSFALTSKDVKSVVPERYGVRVETGCIAAFADNGGTSSNFDSNCLSNIAPAGGDTIIQNFPQTAFQMEVLDGTNAHEALDMPVEIYYENKTGEVTVIDDNGLTIDKSDIKYIAIHFSEIDGTLQKYIVIFQVSGLPEEFDQTKFEEL